MRAEALAVQLLEYGHTVAWVCDATNLPRRHVHRIAEHAGFVWRQDGDTMRRPGPKQPKPVKALIEELGQLIDSVPDPKERYSIRRAAAVLVQRLDRELYPTTTDPQAAPARRRRGPTPKD